MSLPSYADAPFHAPPDDWIGGIVLDLPVPPSVNRIWRAHKAGSARVSLSPEYKAWKKAADNLCLSMAQFRGLKTITGPFEAKIIIKRVRGDIDNRAKAVLDFLQSRSVVVEDKFCERLTIEFGEAPTGCRVMVRALKIASVGDVLKRSKERA